MNRHFRQWALVITGGAVCAQAIAIPYAKVKQAEKLANSGKAREAAAMFESFLADKEMAERQRISCYRLLAYTYGKKLRDPIRAREAIQQAMACDLTKGAAWEVERIHLLAAEMLMVEKKYDEAIAAYRRAMEQDVKSDTGRLMASRLIGEALLWKEKPDESVAVLEQALADFAEAQKMERTEALATLSHAYRRAGKDALAVTAGLDAVVTAPKMFETMQKFCKRCLPVLRKEENRELALMAVKRLREFLPLTIDNPVHCEFVQTTIVKILIDCKEYDQAIMEGSLLVDVCTSANMSKAISTLASTLKSADGNMARANAFLHYARVGTAGQDGVVGTSDDLPDPLGEIQRAPHPERDAAYQKALAEVKSDWQGCLTKATLYRYWERPKEAVAELHNALAGCPMQAEPIQTIVTETGRVLTQISGDPAIGQRFADFQQFGPDGPDRKEGTADDLTNPVLAYLPK